MLAEQTAWDGKNGNVISYMERAKNDGASRERQAWQMVKLKCGKNGIILFVRLKKRGELILVEWRLALRLTHV